MHRCLQVQEIIETILEFSGSPFALASAARTCSLFSEPALNALWGIYGTIDAMLFLMGLDDPSLFVMRSSPRPYEKYEFKRLTITSDWDRFERHSHRIRTITLAFSGSRLSVGVFEHLGEAVPNGILFPNIRQLRCVGEFPSQASNEHLDLLPWVGPELLKLELNFWKTLPSPDTLKQLHTRCPGLKHLIWGSHGGDETVSDLICQYDGLELIKAQTSLLSPRCVEHILSLKSLRELHWRLDESISCNPPVDGPRQYFAQLVRWRQLSNNFGAFISVASCLPMGTTLTTVGLNTYDYTTTASDVQEFYSTLAKQCNPDNLQEITLLTGGSYSPNCALCAIIISPLLPFHNITTFNLTFQSPCTVDFADGFLPKIARAWPLLKSFHLRAKAINVTTSDFVTFVQECGLLDILCVDLADGLKLDSTVLAQTETCKLSGEVTTIMFWETPIQDPDGVAATILTRLFPRLASLQFNNIGQSEQTRAWSSVVKEASEMFWASRRGYGLS